MVEVAESMNEREPSERKCHPHGFGIMKDKSHCQEDSVHPFSFTGCQASPQKTPGKTCYQAKWFLRLTALRETRILTGSVMSQTW